MLWRIVGTLINCLKAGMRGHMGCGGLSRSRRLIASSIPLEPRMSALPFGGVYGALVDQLTCEGLAEGPLVRASICACVKMVAKIEMRMVVFRKMSGRGAGCWRH